MNPTTPTLLLIDGSSYLYRAFHAMPDLRAKPGDPSSEPTGAIRGMINMLQSLKKEIPADYVACVFDAKGPTFRDALYPDYKAHRSPMPDDLRRQIEPIHRVVQLLGWKVMDVPGVEADDVIGTLAVIASQQNMNVVVSSGDKDLAQLVNEKVMIVDTMNGKRRDVHGVLEEFGVTASQMVDYQTLVGDAVDNVPGVPKVGPKTAVKWLQQFGSLQNILTQADSISGAVGDNLRKSLDWLPIAKQLLTVKTDCDLQSWIPSLPSLDALLPALPDTEQLLAFYQHYGFKSLAQALENSKVSNTVSLPQVQPAVTEHFLQVETILTEEQFSAWIIKLHEAEIVALDTETTSLDEMRAQLVGISMSIVPHHAVYIPLAHSYPGAPEQLALDWVLQKLQPWLENPLAKKLGQNTKYDRHVFANHGVQVQGFVHDTMLQSYVLEVHKPHGLASLAERHLGRKGISYEELCGKGVSQIGFNQVDISRAAEYAAEDAEQTLCVHAQLWPQLQVLDKLRFIYELEIASSEVLFKIERNGVLIDASVLAAQSHSLGQRIVELENQSYALAGQPFNLGSPKQIAEIFFQKLGLPVVKKTATGVPSTDEEVLEKLAEDYPLPQKILEHRSLSKLKSTYTDKLAQLALPRTGRVHTHYAQAIAVTGRLSSNEPNLQNIPIRTPEGRKIREAFVAPAGCTIISADYSQIELRIMAHISQDAALMHAFVSNTDVHRATAAEVFGIAASEVSAEQRRYAKVINFGLIYGMSAFGLARTLGIDNTAAKNYINRYFERYPGVKHYMESTRELAKKNGYVETVFGRRLYLPEINSANGPRRAAAERAAINAPMQGTAADLIKLSMVAVQQAIEKTGKSSKMMMQVHDELVFEVPDSEVEWVTTEVPRIMASVAQLKVPLLAEVGVGKNWDQAH